MGHSPDEGLIDCPAIGLGTGDELEEVSALQAFSDDAEAVGELIEEGVAVGEDVGTAETGQDADFIEAVSYLLFGEGGNSHLLESILPSIFLSPDAVHSGEGTLA